MDFKTKEQISKLIYDADAIAVFAGAGMSVDSGLEAFRGNDGLWTKKLMLDGKEVNYYDLMSHSAFVETPNEAWGLIAYLMEKYTETTPHDGYFKLLELLKSKEYFVVTSNVDEHFLKAGFAEMNIFECHGSIFQMQCLDVTEKEIWLTPNISLDKEKMLALNPLPKCPICNSNCRPNSYLFGDWFWVSTRSSHQQTRFNNWAKSVKEKYLNVLAIEFGAGKTINTIRKASENFAGDKFTLIRCNPNDFEVSKPNHIGVSVGAKEFFEMI